jgi:hypothetical protein
MMMRVPSRATYVALLLALGVFVAACGGDSTDSSDGADRDSTASTPSDTNPGSDTTTKRSAPEPAPANETPEEAQARLRAEAKAIMDAVQIPFPGLADAIGEGYELGIETEPLVGIPGPCFSGSSSIAAIGHRYSSTLYSFDSHVWWPRDGASAHMEEVATTEIGCLESFTDAEITEFDEVSLDGADGYRWLAVPESRSPKWTTLVERDGWMVTGISVISAESADQLVLSVLDGMDRR